MADTNANRVVYPSDIPRPEHVNVRVALAAYMIFLYPTSLFENMDQPEVVALCISAKAMLIQFEAIVEAIIKAITPSTMPIAMPTVIPIATPTAIPTAMSIAMPIATAMPTAIPKASFLDHDIHIIATGFTLLLHQYLRDFKKWKVPDEAKLRIRIIDTLIALYKSKKHSENIFPDDPTQDRSYLEIMSQIDRLRQKLVDIAGQQALDDFDQDEIVRQLKAADLAIDEEKDAIMAVLLAHSGTESIHELTSITLPPYKNPETFYIAYECLIDPRYVLPDEPTPGCDSPTLHKLCQDAARSFFIHELNPSFKALIIQLRNSMVAYLKPESIIEVPRPFFESDLFTAHLQPESLYSGFYSDLIRDLIRAIRMSIYQHRQEDFNAKSIQLQIHLDNAPVGDDLKRAIYLIQAMAAFVIDAMEKLFIDKANDK
jgi:hypothetical protein